MYKINEDNFQRTDANKLLEPAAYLDVEDIVLEITGAEDPDEARDVAMALSDKLAVVGDKMPKDLFAKYIRLVKILRLFGLGRVSDAEKDKYFREQVVDTIRTDLVDVKQGTDALFRSFFQSTDIIEGWRSRFLTAMEKNQELIGKDDLTVEVGLEKKVLKPTLQSWLLDYNGSVHVDQATHKRSGYEQTNYVLHAPNVQKLSKEDKNLLLKAIQFYDWLKFDPLRYDFSLPGEKVNEDYDYITLEKPEDIIPKELLDELEKMRAEKAAQGEVVQETPYMKAEKFTMPEEVSGGQEVPQKRKPPVVPRRPAAPVKKEMAEIKTPEAEHIEQDDRKEPAVKAIPRSVEEMEEMMPLRPVNIQDILSRKRNTEGGTSGLKIADKGKDKDQKPRNEDQGFIIDPDEVLAKPQGAKIKAEPEPVEAVQSLKGADAFYKDLNKDKKQKEIDRKLEQLKKKVAK